MVEWELKGKELERADSIHYSSIVIDTALTTNFALPTQIINGEDALARVIRIGGITAAHQTIVGALYRTFRNALNEMNNLNRLVIEKPDKVMIVKKSSDIEKAKNEGKLGLIMAFQGCDPLEDDWVNNLPVFYCMGARIMGLTYNERNLLGYGITEPKDDGLTAYGAQVVRAMNEIGIIVDLSHVGMHTAMDALELSEDPVIFSHSNAKAVTAHFRNITDELIKAVKVKGGMIGIAAWEPMCAPPGKQATLSDYLNHIDYIVNLIGVDYVGIGSDRGDNLPVWPVGSDFMYRYRNQLTYKRDDKSAPEYQKIRGLQGYNEVHDIINVTRGLVSRGYSEEDIKKILGGNFMRVARQVWDKA